jgi:hypothetical protein
LRNPTELNEFRRLINEAKLEALMSAVERVNPSARKTAGAGSKEEVVEI